MSPLRRYLTNAIWSGLWAVVLVLSGFIVSPQIIRKLGESSFSVWTLALSLVEYFWLIDLGLRSATIQFAASFRARGETSRMEVLLNTGLVYSALGGVVVGVLTLAGAPLAANLLRISHPEFPALLRVAGLSWAVGLVFSIFGGYVEAAQRFDLASRSWIYVTAFRSLGVLTALYLGYGLMALAGILLATQTLTYFLTYRNFRKVAPDLRVLPRLASRQMLTEMFRYGAHTLTASIAQRVLAQSIPTAIVYLRPLQELAYWSVSVRSLEYVMDGVGRIGMITTPNAAEIHARGDFDRLRQLGVHTNRFCLALFVPIAAFLLVYGQEVFSLWIRPDFAVKSYQFLPVLLIGYTLTASQFNSSSILYGTGQHKNLARAWLCEAAVTLIGIIVVLPSYGLYGAAWVLAIGMVLNRGVFVCWFFCRKLNISVAGYVLDIARPVVPGLAAFALLHALKHWVWAGQTWREIGFVVVLTGVLYAGIGYFVMIEKEMRISLQAKVLSAFARWRNQEKSPS